MDTYEKLKLLFNKADELEKIGLEYDRVAETDNSIQKHCIAQGALQLANELESLSNLLSDEDLEIIHKLEDSSLDETATKKYIEGR